MQFYFAIFHDIGYAFYAFKIFSPLFYGFSSGDSHSDAFHFFVFIDYFCTIGFHFSFFCFVSCGLIIKK